MLEENYTKKWKKYFSTEEAPLVIYYSVVIYKKSKKTKPILLLNLVFKSCTVAS